MKLFNLGVVVYCPTEEQLDRISYYSKSGFWNKIIVINNTPDSSLSFDDNKIVLINNRKNLGLSKPYNMFISMSKDADYLCLMDQDSIYSDSETKNMIDFINNSDDALSNTCIIAPRSYASVSKKVLREKKLTKTDFVINSGSFLNIKILREKNIQYDENIFLDYLDYDFCYTIKKMGLDIFIYEDSVLYQSLGYEDNGKHANHSPIRFYYACSARKYSLIKNHGHFIGVLLSFFKVCKNIVYIVVNEDSKRLKIKNCLKAQFKKNSYMITSL